MQAMSLIQDRSTWVTQHILKQLDARNWWKCYIDGVKNFANQLGKFVAFVNGWSTSVCALKDHWWSMAIDSWLILMLSLSETILLMTMKDQPLQSKTHSDCTSLGCLHHYFFYYFWSNDAVDSLRLMNQFNKRSGLIEESTLRGVIQDPLQKCSTVMTS